MARNAQGSAHTAPKGRATRTRNTSGSASFLTSKVQWIVVILLGLIVIGALLFIGRDVRSDTGASATIVPSQGVVVHSPGA